MSSLPESRTTTSTPRTTTPSAEPHVLRLFCGEEPAAGEPAGLSPHMTLSAFYDAYVLPYQRQPESRDPKTIKQDRETLGYWRRATGDPPLAAINRETCRLFVEWLKARPGREAGSKAAPNTVRKHCVHLQFILDLAGPGRSRQSEGAGLLDATPYLKRPRATKREATGNFTLEEIWRLLRATKHARQAGNLDGLDPAAFHRALLTFAYNTALRIETVMLLRWEMVSKDEWGWWAIIPPEIYKGHRHGGRYYLNAHALAAAESIRRAGVERLFPWQGWPASQGYLHECRREIQDRAGLKRCGVGYHGLRRRALTWLQLQSPTVAAVVAGHKTGNVTRDYYFDPREVAETMERMPQPAPAKQLTMFDQSVG